MTTETSDTPSVRPPSMNRATAAGWLCLLLGMVLMFVSLGLFFLYGPLFLAAFILSIVAMAQRRIAAGVILLVITLSLPGFVWLGLVVFKVGSSISETEQKKTEALSAVSIEDLKGYVDGNYMYCKGKVRNHGIAQINFVKVEVEWLDGAGNVLDTDYTYAVSSEALGPQGAKSFEIMTPADHRMKRFRCQIK